MPAIFEAGGTAADLQKLHVRQAAQAKDAEDVRGT
jgi:hypothetical protein